MVEEETRKLVIATTNPEKALIVIAKAAMFDDEINIFFIDKYAPTVEYLLRILKKSFGWSETERGQQTVENTICSFNINKHCTNKKILNQKSMEIKCNEFIRKSCRGYKKDVTKMGLFANYVTIEKAGGIRNM